MCKRIRQSIAVLLAVTILLAGCGKQSVLSFGNLHMELPGKAELRLDEEPYEVPESDLQPGQWGSGAVSIWQYNDAENQMDYWIVKLMPKGDVPDTLSPIEQQSFFGSLYRIAEELMFIPSWDEQATTSQENVGQRDAKTLVSVPIYQKTGVMEGVNAVSWSFYLADGKAKDSYRVVVILRGEQAPQMAETFLQQQIWLTK